MAERWFKITSSSSLDYNCDTHIEFAHIQHNITHKLIFQSFSSSIHTHHTPHTTHDNHTGFSDEKSKNQIQFEIVVNYGIFTVDQAFVV